MEWLKTIVPGIATALGGPLAGAAVAFIADKLSVSTEAVTDILTANKMTPDQISALKLAEVDYQRFLSTNKIDGDKVAAADRDSARNMQVANKSTVPAVLTYLLTIGFFGILAAMFKFPEVKESAPLMIMLGSLGTAWTGACAFWFGTTNGSQNKDHLLANSLPSR